MRMRAISVEGEKCQRSEDVEVGLDPAAGQVDQKGRQQHLPDRDHMTRKNCSGKDKGEVDRQAGDRAAQHHGGPEMDMGLAGRTRPGQRRDPIRCRDTHEPLEDHEAGEQVIRAALDRQLILVKQQPCTGLCLVEHLGTPGARDQSPGRSSNGQPNTRVSEGPKRPGAVAFPSVSSLMIVLRPRLSPECPPARP